VFGTHASVFDQSGSRVLLELRGPRARDVLAKGVSIDLHPRAFRTGDVAVTTASHLAVHLWQVADEPVYRLLVVRTYFNSLWRWLAASAAEYGCEVLAPTPYASHAA
jgi:sarcosine oxidase subunit gamma